MNVHKTIKTIRRKTTRNAERQSSEINHCRVLKRILRRCALVEARLFKMRSAEAVFKMPCAEAVFEMPCAEAQKIRSCF